jgi:hypothetical protein
MEMGFSLEVRTLLSTKAIELINIKRTGWCGSCDSALHCSSTGLSLSHQARLSNVREE